MIKILIETIAVIIKLIFHSIFLMAILFKIATVTTKHNSISHSTSIQSYVGYYYCMDNDPEWDDEKFGCVRSHTPLTYVYETLFLIFIYNLSYLLMDVVFNMERNRKLSDILN
jgi:hypothetical protein